MHKCIWLHGWGTDSSIWADLPEGIEAAEHIFIDYGGCAGPTDFYSRLEDILHRQSPEESITLVGWSMGGALAIQAAATGGFPQIDRLVVIGGTTNFCERSQGLGWPGRVVEKMKAGLRLDPNQILSQFSGNMMSDKEAADLSIASNLHHMFVSGSGWGTKELIAGLDYLMGLNLTEHLAEIAIPTLILHGELDRICPVGQSRRMESEIPDATAVYYEETGHIPFLTQNKRVLQELRRFIE